MHPKVSIITPIYNSEDFLSLAIESVLAQSFESWEMLLIDDGSTDNSKKIAKDFSQRDRRIRLIENEKNIGVSATRNKGIDQATGDWIAFLDSDDLWGPKKLEAQIDFANRNMASFIFGSYLIMTEEGEVLSTFECALREDYKSLLRGSSIGCLTVMIKREVLKKHRFKECMHEDFALWLEILRSERIEAFGLQEVIASYRLRPLSRSANKIECARAQWNIYRRVEKLGFMESGYLFLLYARKGILKHWLPHKRHV